MRWPRDHGTDLGGRRDADYCRSCFREGLFTEPNLLLADAIARFGSMAEASQMTHAQALAQAHKVLPGLKRWSFRTP
jgi:hypothetical protein